jgi:heme-degrading monooxygenase HmoA
MAAHHLVQLNIGRIRAPLDTPQLEGFVSALEPINALADRSPGFVWRLQTEEGDATAVRPFDDDMLLVNMSVWESLEALSEFTYRSDHRKVMAGRRQWFERMSEAYLVLWWVPAGHIPTVEEAKERLMLLREKGPTPEAFTFRRAFPPPGAEVDVDEAGRPRSQDLDVECPT